MAQPLTPDQLLEQLKAFAEDFARERLTSYIASLDQPGRIPTSPKEINDAIWGTVKINPLEVVILDSPLVQRLRFVRQLGVVHWVYPGASHARFEHTLGVLFQTQQLISAINLATPAGTSPPIDSNKAGIVRLAALLHDIGHGLFSHVSEHALIKRDDLRLALTRFARILKVEKVQLSELVAYYQIGSPSFKSLLKTALDALGQPINIAPGINNNVEAIVEKIQNAIIGKMIDEQVPLLHELISGPFDADKLDYYTRDARLAGVPTMLDISRLTQKITVAKLPTKDLPRHLSQVVSSASDTHYLFGLKLSGAAVLDELHLARVLLYAKIYRHKKVSAAEAMIEALLDALAAAPGVSAQSLIRLCYNLSDDQLIWADAKTILAAAGATRTPPDVNAMVADVIRRLRNRDLYVNAVAIQPRYPNDPWGDDDAQKDGLQRLIADFSVIGKARRIKEFIVKEILAIAVIDPAILGGVPVELVPHCIVLSAKPTLSGGTEIDRAFVFQGGRPVSYRDVSGVNRPAWADAYDFATVAGMIFVPRELAVSAYIAAEKIFRQEYGVVLPKSSIDISKQDFARLDAEKRTIEAQGFYQGVELDIRPIPTRLSRGDVPGRLEAIAQKFESFDAPVISAELRRPKVLKERIEHWLAQFRDDDFIECGLHILEKFKILSRDDTRSALANFVSKHPEFAGGTIALLGGLKDSASVQAYLAQDLSDKFPYTSTVEEAAKNKRPGPIVFVDDFIGSGGQASDILGNWFQEDSLKRGELQEERLPFGAEEQNYLRERKLGFVFVSGWKDGVQEILNSASELQLDATIHVEFGEERLPFAFDGLEMEVGSEVAARFKARCREIGAQLLVQSAPEKIEERALGYGNRGMLLASKFNVPTQTLTCVWKGGSVDGIQWHPLIHRRPKQ